MNTALMHSGRRVRLDKAIDLFSRSRLYLITSPVVRGESLKFQEDGVRDVLKDVFLPWYNALRLLIQSSDQLKIDRKVTFIYDTQRLYSSMSANSNVMDTWIVSYTQTLLDFVKQEMDGETSIAHPPLSLLTRSLSSLQPIDCTRWSLVSSNTSTC